MRKTAGRVALCFLLWLTVIDEVCFHDALQNVAVEFSPPRESVSDELGLVEGAMCISLPTKIHYTITLHITQGIGVTFLDDGV